MIRPKYYHLLSASRSSKSTVNEHLSENRGLYTVDKLVTASQRTRDTLTSSAALRNTSIDLFLLHKHVIEDRSVTVVINSSNSSQGNTVRTNKTLFYAWNLFLPHCFHFCSITDETTM